jgi:hypothetical protein
MLNSTHLDTDHRQIATMYIDKIDQMSKLFDHHEEEAQQQAHQTPIIDDQSL